MTVGRHAEAIDAFRHAQAHDPLSLPLRLELLRAFLCAGRNEDAIAHGERGLALERGPWPLWSLALALERVGREDEALALMDRAAAQYVTAGWELGAALLLARAGRVDEARARLRRVDPELPTAPAAWKIQAALHVALGEPERAIGHLQEWHDRQPRGLPFDCGYPELRALEGDPRYRELVRRRMEPS